MSGGALPAGAHWARRAGRPRVHIPDNTEMRTRHPARPLLERRAERRHDAAARLCGAPPARTVGARGHKARARSPFAGSTAPSCGKAARFSARFMLRERERETAFWNNSSVVSSNALRSTTSTPYVSVQYSIDVRVQYYYLRVVI